MSVALLKSGYFHKLCGDLANNETGILNELMLTLSHIFGRRTCREVDDEKEAEVIRRSPSAVYLDPMPEGAINILRQHNASTLDIFTTYVKTFASQHIKEEERFLPLTKLAVGAATTTVTPTVKPTTKSDEDSDEGDNWDDDEEDEKPAPAASTPSKRNFEFIPSLPTPKARSAFVALSGHGDNFNTIEDLCSSAREGVFLESAVIPHLDIHPDENSAPLNAYLLDFFVHGSLDPLEKANGIRKSDVSVHIFYSILFRTNIP